MLDHFKPRTGATALGVLALAFLTCCGGGSDALGPQSPEPDATPSNLASVETTLEASWGSAAERPVVDRAAFDIDWCADQALRCETSTDIISTGTDSGDARLIRADPFSVGKFGARSATEVWLWTTVDGLDNPTTSFGDDELLSLHLTELDDNLAYSRVVSNKDWSSEGEQSPETWFFSSQVGPWSIDGIDSDLIGGVDARARGSRDSVVALTLPPPAVLGVGARWVTTGDLGGVETVVARIEVEVVDLQQGQATLAFSGRVTWAAPFQDRGEEFFGGWEVSGTVTWFEDSPVPSALFEIVGEAEFDAIEYLGDQDAPRVLISERRVMSIEPAPPA